MQTANDMYKHSLMASQGLPPKPELPPRLLGILSRTRFVEKVDGKQPRLKTDELREAILNGTIWGVRNIGKTYVKLLSEYLEQIEQNKPASDTPYTENFGAPTLLPGKEMEQLQALLHRIGTRLQEATNDDRNYRLKIKIVTYITVEPKTDAPPEG